jgi:hypothetical protein
MSYCYCRTHTRIKVFAQRARFALASRSQKWFLDLLCSFQLSGSTFLVTFSSQVQPASLLPPQAQARWMTDGVGMEVIARDCVALLEAVTVSAMRSASRSSGSSDVLTASLGMRFTLSAAQRGQPPPQAHALSLGAGASKGRACRCSIAAGISAARGLVELTCFAVASAVLMVSRAPWESVGGAAAGRAPFRMAAGKPP